MHQQLMPQPQFKKIVSNQAQIIEELQKSQIEMSSFLELSNKYLADAIVNFEVGQGYIVRIRQNLDAIHKIMVGVKRKIKRQVEEEERVLEQQKKRTAGECKQEEIKTISESIADSIQQQITLTNSQQPISSNFPQTTALPQPSQLTQIDKLFSYYKLDSQQYQAKLMSSPMFNDDAPTKQLFQQPFKVMGKGDGQDKEVKKEVGRRESDYMLI